MKRIICLGVTAAFVLSFASHIGATPESRAAVLFLLIEPGARAAGMGESSVAISDDATATYYNPAALSGQTGRNLSFTHTKWLPGLADDMWYEFVGYTQPVTGWGNIGINLSFLTLGEQIRTDEFANVLGSFTSYDFAVSGAYAAPIAQNISAGVGMKIIRSNLADVGAGKEKGKGIGTTFGVDVGLLYRIPSRNLNLGMALHNMGPQIAYIDAAQSDPLPMNLVVGAATKVVDTEYNDLLLTLDLYKPLVTDDSFLVSLLKAWGDDPIKDELEEIDIHVGAEYEYSSFLALRTGYSYDKDGDLKLLTFGFGIRYDWVQIDMAYIPGGDTPLQDNTRFTMNLTF